MNVLQEFEKRQIEKLASNKKIPDFVPGDTLKVNVILTEKGSESSRIQAFEGICIARRNRGASSSFKVRKISHGEGVERNFPLYSPSIASIEVLKKGVVRRAKLYYLADLRGKAARIKEKITKHEGKK